MADRFTGHHRPYVARPLARLPRREAPPADVGDGDWITPAEAAALVGVGERTARRRCGAGDYRCRNWRGLGWMVDRASLG
jgi:hypothetical protein